MTKKGNIQGQKGFSLIETLVALGIFSIIALGIYFTYSNLLDVSISSKLKKAAVSVVQDEIELVRNLSYSDVGIVGGAPAGVIPQSKTVLYGNTPFVVEAFVRNIDDAFDGTLGGDPNDTAPADYKLVTFRVSCSGCPRFTFAPIEFVTIAAPIGLESATNNGNLFINVFDSGGLPVTDADIHIENNALNPTVTIDDETNNDGVLQLVDIPTSTVSYEITVTKNGYSSNRTYAPGDFGSSTPVNLHSTVAEQTITEISLPIDILSSMTVGTSDQFCQIVEDVGFTVEGTKLVATTPDIKKYFQATTTASNGSRVLSLEWDTYTITPNDSTYYFSGFTPQVSTTTVNPNSSYSFNAIVEQQNASGLLVTVFDIGASAINDASVHLTGPSTDVNLLTGRRLFTGTDWSAGKYFSQDGGLEVDNPSGEIHLVDQGGGTYATSTESWLISDTIDFGTSTFRKISWNPETQPPTTGSDSLRFQIATNLDQGTWNFLGPDGTANTYYTISSSTISSVHDNDRYLRYRVHMVTEDENITPSLHDATIEFVSNCTPNGQVFFNGLGSGTYSVEVTKEGYNIATSSVSVGADTWHNLEIILSTP